MKKRSPNMYKVDFIDYLLLIYEKVEKMAYENDF